MESETSKMDLPLSRRIETSNSPLPKTCLVALVTATLAACDGSSEDGVSFFGTVAFSNQNARGIFTLLETPTPVTSLPLVTDFFQDVDTCKISLIGQDSIGTDSESITVSAGEVLTAISPAGSFVELNRIEALSGFDYVLADGADYSGIVPVGTVVNIPGDVFPAFTEIDVPVVDELANLTPNSLPISGSTNFNWTPPAENVTSSIRFRLTSEPSPINTFITEVDCTVIDDGSFTFPADTQAVLGPDFEAVVVSVSRTGLNLVTQGNAALLVFTLPDTVTFGIGFGALDTAR